MIVTEPTAATLPALTNDYFATHRSSDLESRVATIEGILCPLIFCLSLVQSCTEQMAEASFRLWLKVARIAPPFSLKKSTNTL